ncbi:hypothetical protein PAPHI01_0088 [Pancytospora philotis]|nr:hypothetical protein PAPHI01_0088 [Pancytospora philotis]
MQRMLSFVMEMMSFLKPKAASAAEIRQQMVFGKVPKGTDEFSHYCDFSCKPDKAISQALIYKQSADADPNKATPQQNSDIKKSPNSKNTTRLSIPSDIKTDGSVYNFKLTTTDNLELYTETWTYDPSRNMFAHASSVKRPLAQNKLFQVALVSLGVVVLLALVFMFVRISRKSKAAL